MIPKIQICLHWIWIMGHGGNIPLISSWVQVDLWLWNQLIVFSLRMKPAKDVEYDANPDDDGDGDDPEQGRALSIVCSKKSAFIW